MFNSRQNQPYTVHGIQIIWYCSQQIANILVNCPSEKGQYSSVGAQRCSYVQQFVLLL